MGFSNDKEKKHRQNTENNIRNRYKMLGKRNRCNKYGKKNRVYFI